MTASGDTAVLVGIATCRRAQAVEELLRSLARLRLPEHAKIGLIVVDNDIAGSAAVAVERARPALGDIPLCYALEPEPGIPFARNRVLQEAQRLGGDLLCFIDDDEYPDPTWLAELVACHRATGAALVGGPVRIAPTQLPLSPWRRLLFHSIAAWWRHKERKSAAWAGAGRQVTVVTNNWLGDLRWIAANDLAFDTSFRYSGGSDTAFFHAAVARGAGSAWCAAAVVHETLPLSRISLSYQFRRGRAQSINHFNQKRALGRPLPRSRTVAAAVLRIALGVLLLLVPVLGVASPVSAVRSIGWGFGRLAALGGARSALYLPQRVPGRQYGETVGQGDDGYATRLGG